MVESSDDQIELGEHVIFISMYRDRSIYWGWPLYRYIAGGIYIDVYIYIWVDFYVGGVVKVTW